MRATRDDVAKLAGVSSAVVSYVLNDGPRPVAAATRERVLEAVQSLGYRPNASARALSLSRTGVIGLLVPDISNPFFSEFAKHVQEVAFEADYSLTIGNTDLDPEREAAQVKSILQREIDGLIVFGIRDPATLRELVSSTVPLVSMDWQLQDAAVPTVVADDYGAAREAVEHLVGHGYSDIGYIGGPQDLRVFNTRQQAWEDVVGPLVGPARLDELHWHGPSSRRGGYEAGLKIFASGPQPRAVFVSSDNQAIGFLRAAREHGVDVPSDLAIASFDGTEDSEYSAPPLTVVQLPLSTMAKHAVHKVLGKAGPLSIHSTVRHTLIVRQSCGCGMTQA